MINIRELHQFVHAALGKKKQKKKRRSFPPLSSAPHHDLVEQPQPTVVDFTHEQPALSSFVAQELGLGCVHRRLV